MGTRARRSTAWIAIVAIAIAGCGDGDGDTSASADDDERDAFCDALRPISDADKETSALVAEGASWSEVQARLTESMPTTVDAYGPAIELAPDDLVEDLQLMRDFSAATVRAAAGAASFEEFADAVAALPDAGPVAAASVRVDEVVIDRCIFSLADN